MANTILGVCLLMSVGYIAVALIAKAAIEAISACARRESESAALAVEKFHASAQSSALHATLVKNERVVEAELNFESERLRFGSPDPDRAPATSRFYDPSHVTASDIQGTELRTVNASGTGVD